MSSQCWRLHYLESRDVPRTGWLPHCMRSKFRLLKPEENPFKIGVLYMETYGNPT